MSVFSVLSFALAISFMGVAIWKKKKLPESISSIVFVFRHKWLWTMWLWTVGFLTLMPITNKLSRIGMEFLGFGTLACLVFCGAMPLFDKDNITKHWVFGVSSCILSQMCVYFTHHELLWLWLVFVLITFFVILFRIRWDSWRTKVLLAETICYATTLLAGLQT